MRKGYDDYNYSGRQEQVPGLPRREGDYGVAVTAITINNFIKKEVNAK